MGMWIWPAVTTLIVIAFVVRFEVVSYRERQRSVARLREHGRPR